MVGLLGCGCCGGGGGETPCDCLFHPEINGPTAKSYVSCGFDDPLPDSVAVYLPTPTGNVRSSRFNRFKVSDIFLGQFGYTVPVIQKWTTNIFGYFPISYMRQLWQFDRYDYLITADSTVNQTAVPFGTFIPWNPTVIPGGTTWYTIGSRMECDNGVSDDTFYLGTPLAKWRYKHGLLVKQIYPWAGIPNPPGVFAVYGGQASLVYAVWERVPVSQLYWQGIRVIHEETVPWGTHNLGIKLTCPPFTEPTIPNIQVSLMLNGLVKYTNVLSNFINIASLQLEWQSCGQAVRSYKGCATTKLGWHHWEKNFWNDNPADSIYYDNFVFQPIDK